MTDGTLQLRVYNPLRYKICEGPSEREGHPLVGGTGWVQGRYHSALETTTHTPGNREAVRVRACQDCREVGR